MSSGVMWGIDFTERVVFACMWIARYEGGEAVKFGVLGQEVPLIWRAILVKWLFRILDISMGENI